MNNTIEIFHDEDGYYYRQKMVDGFTGNYYERDYWPQEAKKLLLSRIAEGEAVGAGVAFCPTCGTALGIEDNRGLE